MRLIHLVQYQLDDRRVRKYKLNKTNVCETGVGFYFLVAPSPCSGSKPNVFALRVCNVFVC